MGGGGGWTWVGKFPLFLNPSLRGTLNILMHKKSEQLKQTLKVLVLYVYGLLVYRDCRSPILEMVILQNFRGGAQNNLSCLLDWIMIRSDDCWLFSTEFLLAYVKNHIEPASLVYSKFSVYSIVCLCLSLLQHVLISHSIPKHFLVCS